MNTHWHNVNVNKTNKRFWMRSMALGLTAALLLTGCGKIDNESTEEGGNALTGLPVDSSTENGAVGGEQQVMGRYVESQINLPEELQSAKNIWKDDEGLNVLSADGSLYHSSDQGNNWQMVSQAPAELKEAMKKGTISYFQQNSLGEIVAGYLYFPADENGNTSYDNYSHQNKLYLSDDNIISLDLPESEYVYSAVCDEEGTFYLGSSSYIFRVNNHDGSIEVLAELSSPCHYLTVCGKYLIIQGEQLQLYDLQNGKMADQDTVLNDFMEPWLGSFGDVGSKPYLFYQSNTDDESIYILTDKGLYRHTLFGSVMEQIIDGSLCSMSNPSLGFVNMLQYGETFLVLYSGGLLKQYTYDAEASAVPENILRVYGLYEDTNVQMVISAFNQKHPDLHVTYEHPLSEDTGMTKEDAMKTLSTQIAAGNGPDIFLLDGLPFDTYVEKGVLADLSETLNNTGEHYIEAVMDSYLRDGKHYAAPMEISVPVLMGASDKIEGIASLDQLAELLEETRAVKPNGSLIGFYQAEDAIKLLAPGSMDSWMTADGKLDSESVEEFLIQAKRIYEAQISGLSAVEIERFDEIEPRTNDVEIDNTDASFQLANSLYFNQPYTLGILDGSASIYNTYPLTAEMMRQQEITFIPMPGQKQFMAKTSQIWAVNAASEMKEQAMELVAYALSAQLRRENTLNSSTTNLDVLEEQIQEALKNEQEMGAVMSMEDINGKEIMIDSGTPSKEDLDTLRTLLEGCRGAIQCDSRIYDAVVEKGQKALTGKLTVEEAVKEIEKEVSLYLSE